MRNLFSQATTTTNKSHIPNRKINTRNCTCIIQNKRTVSTIIIHHRYELCSANLTKWIYLHVCAEIQVHQLYEWNDSYELTRPLLHINTAHTLSLLNEIQFHQLYESNDSYESYESYASYELTRPLPHINTAHSLSVLNGMQFHQLYKSNDSYELTRPLPHISTAHTLSVLKVIP